MKSGNLTFINRTFFFFLLSSIIVQIFAVSQIGEKSILFIVALNFLFFLVFINTVLIKDYLVVLVTLNLIYLVLFDIQFHYSLNSILFQDIPLFILIISGIFIYLSHKKDFSFKITYISKPVVFFTLYVIFITMLGISRSNNSLIQIYSELHHALYYSLSLIFSYLIYKESTYIKLFKIIGIIFLVIALEFISFSVTSDERIVFFQAYISPLVIGVLLSLLLFYKRNTLIFLLFLVILIGMSLTLTRTLWLAIIISVVVLCYFYLLESGKISKAKINFLSIISILICILLIANIAPKKQNSTDTHNAEYRAQSFANPTSDYSFIMRLEIGYYVIQEFLNDPIWGSGFGSYVQYKFTGDPDGQVIYPDNSWLYFLWKGGIVGFSLFLWIYVRMLKSSYYLFKTSENNLTKAISIGIFAGIIGLIPLGFLNAVLIKYKTTVLFGIVLAYLDFELERSNSKLDKK